MVTLNVRSMTAVFAWTLMPGLAFAQEPAPASEPAPPAEAAAPTDTGAEATATEEAASAQTINIDVEAASAYVWRGLNLFAPEDYNKQILAVFPSVTALLGPLSVGYWGAYQLTGESKSVLIDGGVGAETDLVVSYGGSISDELTYSARLTAYIYPFADEEVAGTSVPLYLEPGVALTYLTGADLGLYVGYYRGMQDATKDYSFVYISPSVSKTLAITDATSLALSLSAGYKLHTGDYLGSTEEDDQFDLQANVGATFPFADAYVTPQVHAAYLTHEATDFGDEFIAWAGVHVGYNIGL